ncbi:MAG TPA: LytTR family DNA-binding domain-containing protein [Flavisolibacter sp.]|nr:LytTR family DNA-binding domain-containing protein [Flavisolibacter sp.]
MIRAIIVDDELHCINRLKELLDDQPSERVAVLGYFQTVEEGLKGIRALQPDLLFLDIRIGEQSGFDLLKEVGNHSFEVIFTTAYDRFAVQAFKFSALDYLLKPVDREDLQHALEKMKSRSSTSELKQKLEAVFENMKLSSKGMKKISIPTINGLVMVPLGDIVRCQSEINYTIIYLQDKQKLVVAKTLKEYEELLADYDFFRVHNSHLINLAYIKSYQKGKGGMIRLTDGTEIEVSLRRKEEFLKKLSEI